VSPNLITSNIAVILTTQDIVFGAKLFLTVLALIEAAKTA